MNRNRPFLHYLACVFAAAACATALAMHLSAEGSARTHVNTAREAYLDCARMSSVREPDLVTICTVLAGAGAFPPG